MAKRTPKDDFQLNEPSPRVRGGRRRKSVRVSRARLPEIARRERLNRLLLAHDPEDAAKSRAAVKEEDFGLLRQIAAESAVAGTPPAMRQHAIALLADRPTAENLNALEDLAQRGDDLCARGAALAALGRTGIRMAAPILATGLAAKGPIEASAAEHGVVALGRALGEPTLRAAFAGERRKRVLERLDRALERTAEPDEKRPVRNRKAKPAPRSTSKR